MNNRIQPETEIRSEEVQEIISHVPGWINRWGISAIFVFFVLLLTLSWFVKYPDTIPATVVITSSPPPIALLSKSSGQVNLLQADGAILEQNDIIGFVKSTAHMSSVLELDSLLALDSHVELSGIERTWQLGELQHIFSNYVNALDVSQNLKSLAVHQKKVNGFMEQISSYQKLNRSVAGQLKLQKSELLLSKQKIWRDSLLFSQGVISEQDYNTAQATFLQAQRNLKVAESNLVNNEIQINILQNSIAELKAQHIESEVTGAHALRNSRDELMAQIAKWKESYLFVAPIDGKLAYLKFIDDFMYIEAGKELFSIVPDINKIYAQAEFPITGAGKVQIGQRVNIQLKNYPHEQFGMVTGEVVHISELASNDNYLARISIEYPLKTTYKKDLIFKQQLKGDTKIITEDLRVLERLLYQFRALMQDRIK